MANVALTSHGRCVFVFARGESFEDNYKKNKWINHNCEAKSNTPIPTNLIVIGAVSSNTCMKDIFIKQTHRLI